MSGVLIAKSMTKNGTVAHGSMPLSEPLLKTWKRNGRMACGSKKTQDQGRVSSIVPYAIERHMTHNRQEPKDGLKGADMRFAQIAEQEWMVKRMDDLISRQAAIDELNKLDVSDGVGISAIACGVQEAAISAIQNLHSAQPEQRWIPCSERLPSYCEDVILSIGKYCNVGYLVAVNDETDGEWYYSGWYHPTYDVSAWMPLPDPYKERRE